jgi:GTP cyclohydrolase IA
MPRPSRREVEAAVRTLLRAMGEDPARAGLAETPALVAEAIPELFRGVGRDPAQALEVVAEGADTEVAIEHIAFTSWCEHHLLPFTGQVSVRYMPRKGRVAGLGAVARAVDIAASRPTLQERLAHDVAAALWRALRPEWVEVRVRAVQLCLTARGARAHGAEVETVAKMGSPG